MTLIAARVTPERIDALTDSLSYGAQMVTLGLCPKVHGFPHLDAVVLVRGPGDLANAWVANLRHHVGDFDSWDEIAAEQLPVLWQRLDTRAGVGGDGWVMHLGWSESQARFVGYEYASENEWQSSALTDDVVHASPPAPAINPADDDGWRTLAADMFATYCSPTAERRSLFGADLILSTLERGRATHRRIGGIALTEPAFREALLGTCHPMGQLGPCPCGSGDPFAICCTWLLAQNKPCVCGSGLLFRDCHWIDPTTPAAADYINAHLEDYVPRADLRKHHERWLAQERARPD